MTAVTGCFEKKGSLHCRHHSLMLRVRVSSSRFFWASMYISDPSRLLEQRHWRRRFIPCWIFLVKQMLECSASMCFIAYDSVHRHPEGRWPLGPPSGQQSVINGCLLN